MKFAKTLTAAGVFAAGFSALWIAGPPPLVSGPYVQCVTPTSAIVAKIDPTPRRLTLRVWAARSSEQASGARGAVVEVTEEAAATMHAITVSGLQPDTAYGFALETDGERVDGGTFRTAPARPDAVVRFAAVGDAGQMPWWYNMHRLGWSRLRGIKNCRRTEQWEVAKWIEESRPHFFLHLGDMVYWPELHDGYEEGFFRPFGELLRRTALYTMVGNHDIPRDGSRPPFESIFRNPSPAGVGRPQRNYTASWGPVRLVVLDVIDPGFRTGKTREWLVATLRSATEPWLVVAIHRPCFTVYRAQEDKSLSGELWSVLVAHGVDLVISGDDHHFARFRRTSPDSPIQVIAGAGGKSLYEFDASDPRLAASARTWSFLSVEAEGLRLTGRAHGSATEVIDEFTIDRRTGPLPANIHAGRRRAIEGLRE